MEQNNKLSMSRRHFVGVASILGASLGLAACGQSEQAAPEKKPEEAKEKSAEATKPAEEKKEGAGLQDEYDLVVVGAGGAGLSTAISAFDAGVKNICVLEKMGVVGGNSNFATSGMNASETKYQKEQGIEDSNVLFADETFKGGYELGNRELVDFMCQHSAGAIDWLAENGIVLDNLTQTGGMSVKRCHRPTDGAAVGGVLIKGLKAAMEKRSLPIFDEHKVTKLVKEGDSVNGLEVETKEGKKTIKAKAIVLAAGGLGSNQEMIKKYRPDLEGYVSTNHAGATGDGYVLGEEAGAELIQMDQIQIHPTVEQSSAKLIGEALRGSGGILVNKEAKRFTNEMDTRDKVSAAELKQPEKIVYLIFDQKVYDANKAAAKYEKAGITKKGTDLADLAKQLELDPTTLQATVDAYNEVAGGKADEFGRTTGLAQLDFGTAYAIKVAPGIHHAMGGIKINDKNQALDKDNNPIKGFYAAGEVTGGIHGGNRIGGNAVCDIIVFGKNTGEQVAEFLKA